MTSCGRRRSWRSHCSISSEPLHPTPTDMAPRIALIPGDGIGPEVVGAAVRVANAAAACDNTFCEWVELPWGTEHYLQHGCTMPSDGLQLLRGFDAILLGAVGDPRVPDTVTLQELIFPIRRTFEQYLNLRPCR